MLRYSQEILENSSMSTDFSNVSGDPDDHEHFGSTFKPLKKLNPKIHAE